MAIHRSRIVADPKVEMEGISFDLRIMGGLDLLSFFRVPRHFQAEAADPFVSLIQRICAVAKQPDEHAMIRVIACKALTFQVLRLLVGASEPRVDLRERMELLERFRPLTRAIQDDLSRDWTIEEMAQTGRPLPFPPTRSVQANVPAVPDVLRNEASPAKSGHPPPEHAAPVGEIAEEVGWHDPFYFSRAFKAEYGTSPREFRTQLGSNPYL